MDNIDKQMIYELGKNCRIPETRLAKMVGKSKEAVRYRIRKLLDAGIITGFHAHINLSELGFEAHKLYFRTREKPALMHSFISHMRARPDVFWFGSGDGAWNIGLTFFAKDNAAFYDAKNEIFSRFKDIVLGVIVGTVVQADSFGNKFLAAKPTPAYSSQILGQRENNHLDKLNLSIINCLVSDGRMPYVHIASKTGISPESVRNRIKELERLGIISKYSLSLDNKKLGYEYYKTFFYFEGLVKKQERRLFEIARGHPNVVNYLKVLAPWDVEFEIMAENYHSYNEIINYFRKQFPEVLVKVETTVQSVDELFPSGLVPNIAEP